MISRDVLDLGAMSGLALARVAEEPAVLAQRVQVPSQGTTKCGLFDLPAVEVVPG